MSFSTFLSPLSACRLRFISIFILFHCLFVYLSFYRFILCNACWRLDFFFILFSLYFACNRHYHWLTHSIIHCPYFTHIHSRPRGLIAFFLLMFPLIYLFGLFSFDFIYDFIPFVLYLFAAKCIEDVLIIRTKSRWVTFFIDQLVFHFTFNYFGFLSFFAIQRSSHLITA